MALATPGCLVTDTPDFTAPVRTPPFLTNFAPRPEGILRIPLKDGTRKEDRNYVGAVISFDVVSNDLGDDLEALVFLNFKGINKPPDALPLCEQPPIPPDTIPPSDPLKPRTVSCSFQLTPQTAPGCHSVTAVVSHEFVSVLPSPATSGDLAMATWFFQVGIDESDPFEEPMWGKCIPNPRPLDGGADAPYDGGRP